MKKNCLIFLIVALFFSCKKEAKIIPKSDMRKIYKEIFLADQWLNNNYQEYRAADTTFFYGAIFEKYGYTLQDYKKSIAYYLNDSERFSKMFKQISKDLELEIEKIEKAKKQEDELIDRKRRLSQIKIDVKIFKIENQTLRDTVVYDRINLNILEKEYYYKPNCILKK